MKGKVLVKWTVVGFSHSLLLSVSSPCNSSQVMALFLSPFQMFTTSKIPQVAPKELPVKCQSIESKIQCRINFLARSASSHDTSHYNFSGVYLISFICFFTPLVTNVMAFNPPWNIKGTALLWFWFGYITLVPDMTSVSKTDLRENSESHFPLKFSQSAKKPDAHK